MYIINIYAPNNTAYAFMKSKLEEIQGDIDRGALIIGLFNIPLLVQNRFNELRIRKDTDDPNNIIT